MKHALERDKHILSLRTLLEHIRNGLFDYPLVIVATVVQRLLRDLRQEGILNPVVVATRRVSMKMRKRNNVVVIDGDRLRK